MSATRVSGARVTGTTDTTMYTGRGRLQAVMVSHAQATVQEVTVKDNATTLMVIEISPESSPFYVKFGHDKLDGISFTTSLIVNPGLNCKVNIWYDGY